MESILATQNDQSSHQPVILTGCPYSGWEMALSVAGQLALEEIGATAMSWLDDLFQDVELSVLTRFDSNLQPDFSLLEAGFEAEKPVIIADDRYIHLLDQCASQFPNARFLLFYTRAEIALASAIEKDIDPNEFIETWSQANRRLMQFQRRYRGRAILFDAEAAVHHPSEFAHSCQRIGLEHLETEIELFGITAALPGAMERLMARHLLSDAAEILTLQDELEAIAIPLGQGEVALPQGLTEVFGEYLQSKTNVERITRDGDEKTRVVEDQLQQLEALETERDKQDGAAQKREQQLNKITQELEVFKEKQSEASQENELLLLQLRQVQEELEAVFLNKQQLEKDRKAAETEHKKLQQQHDKLASEHDVQQKSLAQANKTLGELKQQLNNTRQEVEANKGKQSETEQENELLLLQLHQVQEELEHYYLLYQESTQKAEPEETKAEDAAKEQENEPVSKQQSGDTNHPGFLGLFRGGKTRARKQEQEQEKIRLLNDSGLFDKEWYLSEYPDIAEDNYEPVKHYLRFGASEERDPSPDFSTSYYIGSNPDILKSGVNPLVHYIRFGRDEGRLPRDMSAD